MSVMRYVSFFSVTIATIVLTTTILVLRPFTSFASSPLRTPISDKWSWPLVYGGKKVVMEKSKIVQLVVVTHPRANHAHFHLTCSDTCNEDDSTPSLRSIIFSLNTSMASTLSVGAVHFNYWSGLHRLTRSQTLIPKKVFNTHSCCKSLNIYFNFLVIWYIQKRIRRDKM